jgi:putative nucleotidyltransferase with HDIG domain
MPTRDEAWQLVCEWTESDSLRKHMLAVEAAVRAYARRLGGDEELWAIAGLVHDLDYERYPDLETGHPRHGVEELRRRSYPEQVVHAVLGHADFMGVPRETQLDKVLFACDELAGFIAACAYVRPEGIAGMKPKSVKKKLKQPSFAAGVDRDDVYRGAEELEPETGMSFDEHLQLVIDALAEHAEELGLTGRGEPSAATD